MERDCSRLLAALASRVPVDQCRMQLGRSGGYHVYTSTWHCLRKTVAEEGIMSLSRGLGGTMAREIPGNAIYFTSYEVCISPGMHVGFSAASLHSAQVLVGRHAHGSYDMHFQ
jgi:Mitochondrial carrier protein